MQNLILRVCGNRETIEIAANSNYEIVFNEIDNALRKLYEISNHRRRYGNKCLCFRASVGKNELLFGIGLSADDSGKIIWECNYGFDRIARGTTKYSRYVDGAFWYMASMIINHFGLTDLQTQNEAEEQARQDEIADTLSNEASALSDEAKTLYNEAKEISDKIGTFLHYTDDPDDEHDALINMAMEMREKLYRIKRIREDFLDRADELTGCNCVFGDFMSDDDMIVDGFDLKYTDPDDIFCSLWNLAWQCYDGHPKSCDIFHDILYGFAA